MHNDEIAANLTKQRRKAAREWLKAQLQPRLLVIDEVYQRLKQRGATITQDAVKNWFSGRSGINPHNLAPLLTVLEEAAANSPEMAPDQAEQRQREALDWLALQGQTAASLPNPERSREVKAYLEQLCHVEQSLHPFPGSDLELPASVVKRDLCGQLADRLLTPAGFRHPLYRAVILHGLSGHGASTVAKMLWADERLPRWYRDGRLELKVGKYDTEASLCRQLGLQLSIADSTNFIHVEGVLCELHRRYLFVVDGVGNWPALLAVLRHLSPQAQLLVIVDALPEAEARLSQLWGAQAVASQAIPSLTEPEAQRLARRYGAEIAPADEAAFHAIWQAVGGHPDFIIQLSLQTRRHSWSDILEVVQTQGLTSSLARLSAMRCARLRTQIAGLPVQLCIRFQHLCTAVRKAKSFNIEMAALVWDVQFGPARTDLAELELYGLVQCLEPLVRFRLAPAVAVLFDEQETESRRRDGEGAWARRIAECSPPGVRNALRFVEVLPELSRHRLEVLEAVWQCDLAAAQRQMRRLAMFQLIVLDGGPDGGDISACTIPDGLYGLAEQHLSDEQKLCSPAVSSYLYSPGGRQRRERTEREIQEASLKKWWTALQSALARQQRQLVPTLLEGLGLTRSGKLQPVTARDIREGSVEQWAAVITQQIRDRGLTVVNVVNVGVALPILGVWAAVKDNAAQLGLAWLSFLLATMLFSLLLSGVGISGGLQSMKTWSWYGIEFCFAERPSNPKGDMSDQ